MPDLIRGAVLKGIPELIGELGVSPCPVLRDNGFDLSDLEHPDRFISFRKFVQLLNSCAEITNCPHFGLLLSCRQGVATLGMLGIAMQQSPDLASAMQTFKRYFYLHTQAASIETSVKGKLFIGTYTVELQGQQDLKQVLDLSIGHGLRIIRFLCGSETNPRAIYFTHDSPSNVKPYNEFFNLPIQFNAEFNGLIYDVDILQLPIRQHDDEMHKVLCAHLLGLEQQHPNDLVSQVGHVIRQMLPTGNCTIDLTASCLNMSKRTLQNHLKVENASFQQILDQIRSDIASNYLNESDVSMTYLSEILGFSELSAFSRAFKRWFGVCPRTWKSSVLASEGCPLPAARESAACNVSVGSFSPIAGSEARLTAIEKSRRYGSEQFAWRIRREGAISSR